MPTNSPHPARKLATLSHTHGVPACGSGTWGEGFFVFPLLIVGIVLSLVSRDAPLPWDRDEDGGWTVRDGARGRQGEFRG